MAMRIVTGITSVPGERSESRHQVYADLCDAGFGIIHYSMDDGMSLGPYGNFQKCLRHLVNVYDRAEFYLIVQDDVRIAKNLRPWLDTQWDVIKDAGCISLYCAGPHHKEKDGWFDLDPCEGKNSYGALALMMSCGAAVEFLLTAPNPGCKTRTCFWMAEWCKKRHLRYKIHSPSLVMHTGIPSLVNPDLDSAVACKPFRQAKCWRPDAMLPDTVDLSHML